MKANNTELNKDKELVATLNAQKEEAEFSLEKKIKCSNCGVVNYISKNASMNLCRSCGQPL